MSAAGKKMMIELPLKVLTEDGASNFISHKKKLIRFRLADNIDEYGISMHQFSPQSIQMEQFNKESMRITESSENDDEGTENISTENITFLNKKVKI